VYHELIHGSLGFTTTTIILQLFWILSGTTQVSWHQKGKTRKAKPIRIHCSKRQWVAVAPAGPYANPTRPQIDNHGSTQHLVFLQVECPSCCIGPHNWHNNQFSHFCTIHPLPPCTDHSKARWRQCPMPPHTQFVGPIRVPHVGPGNTSIRSSLFPDWRLQEVTKHGFNFLCYRMTFIATTTLTQLINLASHSVQLFCMVHDCVQWEDRPTDWRCYSICNRPHHRRLSLQHHHLTR